jgi:hypothetical protein
VKWFLVHYDDDELRAHWERWFGPEPDVEIVSGDICQLAVDAIVSPTNSLGFMDGELDQALSSDGQRLPFPAFWRMRI